MEKVVSSERENEKSRRSERSSRSATIFKNILISNATKRTKNTQQECACWCVCVCVGVRERGGDWQGRFVGVHGARCTVHSACQLLANPLYRWLEHTEFRVQVREIDSK